MRMQRRRNFRLHDPEAERPAMESLTIRLIPLYSDCDGVALNSGRRLVALEGLSLSAHQIL